MSTMPQIILAGQQHPIQGPADWKKEALTIGDMMARRKITEQQAVGLSQEYEMRQRQIDEAKALQEAVRKNYAGAPAATAPGATPGAGLPAAQPQPQAPAGQPLTVGQLGTQTAPQAPPAPPPGQTTVAAVAGQPAAAAQPSGGLPDAAVQGIANAALKGETMPTSFGHPGVNYDGVINDLMRGGHLNAAQSISQNLFKWRSDQLKLQQEQVKMAADKASRLGALAGSVKDPQTLDYALGQAMREGLIDPQMGQALMKEGYTTRTVQLLDQFKTAATTAEQQIQNNRADLDYAQKVVEFKHKVATEAPKSALEWMKLGGTLFTPDMTTNQITAALGSMKAMGAPQEIVDRFDQAVATSGAKGAAMLGMTPNERAEADYRQKNPTETSLAAKATDPSATPEQRAAAEAALKRLDQSKREARPVTNVTIPGTSAATSNLVGADYLASLPKAFGNQVKAIAEGRSTIPGASSRNATAQAIRAAVFQYDPDFNEQRAQVRKAFTTGPDGRNIGALNTATVHLDQFAEAAKALANNSIKPGNQLKNYLKSMFGDAAPSNFAALKSAVSGEMAAALKGNATDIEIHNVAQSIDAASSPDQLAGVISTNLHVLAAKLNTYQERYRQQNPNDEIWSPVLPSAKAVYERHGVSETPAAGGATNPPQGGGKKPEARPSLSDIFGKK